MGFAIFALLLAALSAEYARGLVIVKPQVIPSVIKHAVAAFGPQDIGDPEKCKKNKNDCFPATQGELVGIKKLESGSRDIIYCCDPDELPTELPKDDFIIVAMRDECEFSTKALVAQNAGAKGLIVYNSMFGEELEIMRQVDGPDILIPSIFITRESGDEILELIASDQEVVAVINATGSWSWEGDNWQLTVLWFLFVAFIAMWVIVLACFSGAICRRWCHKTQRQRAVGSLKRRKYKKVVVREESAGDSKQEESANNHEANNCGCDPESQFDQDSCVICLSEFENGENVTTLPCGHDYHTECIKPWLLKRSSKCPICKASFVTKKKKKSRTGASSSTLDANSSTPLLGSGSNGDDAEGIIDNDEGEELESGSESEDIPEFDEENNYPAFWPSSVLGLSPGGLVLTAACTTGIGIAVAIVIFLLKSSEP